MYIQVIHLKVAINDDVKSNKGRNFKNAMNEDEPKKGILVHKSCSNCSIVVKENYIIKCAHCTCRFHCKSVINPVPSEACKQLNDNPTLWWICTGCLKEAADHEKDALIECDGDASQLGVVSTILQGIIKNSITELKSDLFTEMDDALVISLTLFSQIVRTIVQGHSLYQQYNISMIVYRFR